MCIFFKQYHSWYRTDIFSIKIRIRDFPISILKITKRNNVQRKYAVLIITKYKIQFHTAFIQS